MIHEYELKLDTGKIVTWTGTSGEDAAMRAADCLKVTVVAWRYPETYVGPGPVHHRQVID